MLRVDQLRYTFAGFPPLTFDFSLGEGAMLGVTGPSGAGKSTLFNVLAGFLRPQSGQVSWRGESVLDKPPAERPFGLLFQTDNLFEHLPVMENVGLGICPGRLSAAQRSQCQSALDALDVGDLSARLPDELSGGQQQRVALARCLVSPRPVMLLDEPFSALDPESRRDALAAVQAVNQRGKTLLLITHEVADLAVLGAPEYRIGK